MALTEDIYRKLKKEVEFAKEEAARARGSLDTLMGRLEEEFGTKDVARGRKMLADLDTKTKEAEKAFEKAAADYEKTWKKEEQD